MVACFVFNIDLDIIDRDILVSDNRVTPGSNHRLDQGRPAKPSP